MPRDPPVTTATRPLSENRSLNMRFLHHFADGFGHGEGMSQGRRAHAASARGVDPRQELRRQSVTKARHEAVEALMSARERKRCAHHPMAPTPPALPQSARTAASSASPKSGPIPPFSPAEHGAI